MEITFNNKYKSKEIIAKGGFGIVYKVSEIGKNNLYALKYILKKDVEDEKYQNEIEIMKDLNKKNNKYIIRLIENFEIENQAHCIVMELCDGSLKDILKKYKPNGLPLDIIKKIFKQLNEALKTMIAEGITHRDLKPDNILIKYTDANKNDFDIKLTDFGLSTGMVSSLIKTHTNAGTEIYMAPEINKNNADTNRYNNKCDLWSLGIILYELYTNEYIFDSDESRNEGKVKKTDNEMINKLIGKLIQVDIDKRIGWEEYFNDDFFKIKEEKEKNKKGESELNGNLLVK